ncbi:type II toxin-antitoxin system RelE/ParE family toxin [Pseudomonas sp. Irchel 3A5]|uniref:type II toxin-antitoxin system RelE/ParE family toxin n=1 Tax=Pseudomonas sp. Irchel 3A5 TaxID=2008911 RepID=UPI000BA44E25|nr:type II toxin-antitoxin system RelE/ParE family toxin [Pseudomonas sp. Irchel 3A5]
MIKSFQHKGLKAFYETGTTKGIRADHEKRLRFVLAALDEASAPIELGLPGYRLHSLKGQLAGFWSMTISGNWRIIFRFIETDVELVDYLDYH